MKKNEQREQALFILEKWTELPLIILGFIWLLLLIIELTYGFVPFLDRLSFSIWIIFIIDFAIKFAIVPKKINYLKNNWLMLLTLLVPAFRVFRLVRVLNVVRLTRSLRLITILGSIRRGMVGLSKTFGRHGFPYLLTLTLVIIFVGAAGILSFENQNPDGRGLHDYGSALWWTAMIITTMGSDYWPQTVEGRLLTLFLAFYGFAIFGYVAGTIATYFIDRQVHDSALPNREEIAALTNELKALRKELSLLKKSPPS